MQTTYLNDQASFVGSYVGPFDDSVKKQMGLTNQSIIDTTNPDNHIT
jgi:hypothetical protein